MYSQLNVRHELAVVSVRERARARKAATKDVVVPLSAYIRATCRVVVLTSNNNASEGEARARLATRLIIDDRTRGRIARKLVNSRRGMRGEGERKRDSPAFKKRLLVVTTAL